MFFLTLSIFPSHPLNLVFGTLQNFRLLKPSKSAIRRPLAASTPDALSALISHRGGVVAGDNSVLFIVAAAVSTLRPANILYRSPLLRPPLNYQSFIRRRRMRERKNAVGQTKMRLRRVGVVRGDSIDYGHHRTTTTKSNSEVFIGHLRSPESLLWTGESRFPRERISRLIIARVPLTAPWRGFVDANRRIGVDWVELTGSSKKGKGWEGLRMEDSKPEELTEFDLKIHEKTETMKPIRKGIS